MTRQCAAKVELCRHCGERITAESQLELERAYNQHLRTFHPRLLRGSAR